MQAVPYAITVQPKQGGPAGIQWILCDVNANQCGGPGTNPPSDYPQILLPARTGPYNFTVTIKDPSFGITFMPVTGNPTSADAALWVTRGQGQHPGQGNNSAGQITDAALSGSGSKTLTFTDKNNNQNEMWLSYALNFTGPNNSAVNSIDPDIKNGGTQFDSGISAMTVAIISLAIISALVLVYLRLRSVRRQSMRP